MASWRELAADVPELGVAAEPLLRDFTLAYLATVRRDGGPRVHPVTITLHDGDLYVFVVGATPKRADLQRDGRYALHSFPRFPNGTIDSYVDDELVLRGTAVAIGDAALREAVACVHNDTVHDGDVLFRLDVDHAQYKTRRDGRAVYARWPSRAAPGRR